jgi:hypothetical protein
LADAAYPLLDRRILTPYKGERYHLKDFNQLTTLTPNEFFNRRHSGARVTIERVIGLFKQKFSIFEKVLTCDPQMINFIIVAAALIYNFCFDFDWNAKELEDVVLPVNISPMGDFSGSNSVEAQTWRDELKAELILSYIQSTGQVGQI